VTETVQIVRMPWRFGSSLPYFLCPGGCGRRVGKLYFSRGRFLCRHCGQLTYAAQYEQPWQRASRRASKSRQRLDITGTDVPEKPKGRRLAPLGLMSEMGFSLRSDAAAWNAALA
jgi:hypothetical protein